MTDQSLAPRERDTQIKPNFVTIYFFAVNWKLNRNILLKKTMTKHKTATHNGNKNNHLAVNSRTNTLERTAIEGIVGEKCYFFAVKGKLYRNVLLYALLFGIYHKTITKHKTATHNENKNKHLTVNSRINTLERTVIEGTVEKNVHRSS